MSFSRSGSLALAVFAAAALVDSPRAFAQTLTPEAEFTTPATELVAAAIRTPVQTKSFGDLAEGPYNRLVIQNAMVIPGHGGPPVGPYDIVIEGNVITEMTPFDPVTAERRGDTQRASGDRVIDASGKYVMPGMLDLHMHLREEPMPIEYVYYLKLAHGVTSLVPAPDRGVGRRNAGGAPQRGQRNPRPADVADLGVVPRRGLLPQPVRGPGNGAGDRAGDDG